jgi:hypothetical protein
MCAAVVPLLLAAGHLAFGQGGDFSCWIITFGILGVVAFLAVAGYVLRRQEKKRTEALRQAAEEIQFDFTPEDDGGLQNDLAGRSFSLFAPGRTGVYNVLCGRAKGVEVAIFDYNYHTGGGRYNRAIHMQTVVAFRFGGPPVPAFSLRPGSVWHKIGFRFGHQDIDFAEHRVFSSRYQLRGPNETAIREVFTGEVLSCYEGLEGVSTEANGDRLLYYRDEKRVDPERIRPFLEEGFKVLALFHPPGAAEEKARPGAE